MAIIDNKITDSDIDGLTVESLVMLQNPYLTPRVKTRIDYIPKNIIIPAFNQTAIRTKQIFNGRCGKTVYQIF